MSSTPSFSSANSKTSSTNSQCSQNRWSGSRRILARSETRNCLFQGPRTFKLPVVKISKNHSASNSSQESPHPASSTTLLQFRSRGEHGCVGELRRQCCSDQGRGHFAGCFCSVSLHSFVDAQTHSSVPTCMLPPSTSFCAEVLSPSSSGETVRADDLFPGHCLHWVWHTRFLAPCSDEFRHKSADRTWQLTLLPLASNVDYSAYFGKVRR